MCRAVTCKVCGKTTWAGCGKHIDQVKAQVPQGQWCSGHSDDSAAMVDHQPAGGGVFSRLCGRRRRA